MKLRRTIKRFFRSRFGSEPTRKPALARGVFPPRSELAGIRLPDFFIAGAARCGTTSLWEYLRQHPDIYMPAVFELKEPSFFCDLYGIKDWKEYLALFSGAGERKMIGEASGPYLTSPESPGLIKQAIPEARFIISLRNPADRAFSKYKWMRANGYETTPSFVEALEIESSRQRDERFKRNNGQYFYNFLYWNCGLYHAQVQRFFDTFGPKNVKVVIFEEWIRDPLRTVQELFSFLGVSENFQPSVEVHNVTDKQAKLDPELRRVLLDRYQESIVELERCLKRDLLSLWR